MAGWLALLRRGVEPSTTAMLAAWQAAAERRYAQSMLQLPTKLSDVAPHRRTPERGSLSLPAAARKG